MLIEDGWLIPEGNESNVIKLPTIRTCKSISIPLGIVWHWTGGQGGSFFGERLCRRIQTYRRGIDRPASWHVLIARDGIIYQCAPFSVGTWHVGRPGVIAGQRFENINCATIGCELENAGRLRKIGERFYCWPYWRNPSAPVYERRADPRCEIDTSRTMVIHGQGIFDVFSTKQQTAATEMLMALVACFSWSQKECLYGHRDFDPKRKEDPGPVWADTILPQILNHIFGSHTPTGTPNAAQRG